jgi:hypothetical protein
MPHLHECQQGTPQGANEGVEGIPGGIQAGDLVHEEFDEIEQQCDHDHGIVGEDM